MRQQKFILHKRVVFSTPMVGQSRNIFDVTCKNQSDLLETVQCLLISIALIAKLKCALFVSTQTTVINCFL